MIRRVGKSSQIVFVFSDQYQRSTIKKQKQKCDFENWQFLISPIGTYDGGRLGEKERV